MLIIQWEHDRDSEKAGESAVQPDNSCSGASKGQVKDEVNVWGSVAADRRRNAKTKSARSG
jgi:hypothetical protein